MRGNMAFVKTTLVNWELNQPLILNTAKKGAMRITTAYFITYVQAVVRIIFGTA